MKCAKLGCNKQAFIGQKYCSAGHAPYAHLSSRGPSKSERTARSTAPAHGVQSPRLSEAKPRRGRASIYDAKIPNSLSASVSAAAPISERTETRSAPETAPTESDGPRSEPSKTPIESREPEPIEQPKTERTGSGTTVMQSQTEEKSVSAASAATQSEDFTRQSINFDAERSRLLSLTGSSAEHLYALMRSIVRPPCEINEVGPRLDVARVNAACNCAKNLQGMLRLKLDVLKGKAGQ